MKVCSIVARNYLAHARVLAHSLGRHNPTDSFHLLLLDDPDKTITSSGEGYEVLRPDQIGLDAAEVNRMLAIYDVRELATALKPWLLRTLRDRDQVAVVYLDPDIEVFDTLAEVELLARDHPIVLTPHSTKPLPHDRKIPNEPFTRQAGVFNLGFIAIGSDTDPFLDWWSERLRRDCVIDVERGIFVDQSWIDLVPCYFNHYVLKDPGYNVAYWNLHARTLTLHQGAYLVDGKPLKFFHYSGFSPETPHVLTKYAGDVPRVLMSDSDALQELCANYTRSLHLNGYREEALSPYRYATLANGLRLDSRMRRIYREALTDAEARGGNEPPNPYGQPDEFRQWLREPCGQGLGREVSRYLLAIWKERPDLQRAFPDLAGPDARRLWEWGVDDAERNREIQPGILPQHPAPPPARSAPVPLAEGVNVAGYFRAEQGLGEGARLLVRALDAAGIPTSTLTYDQTANRQTHPFDERDAGGHPYDVNLVEVNADMFRFFVNDVGAEFFLNRHTVGIWAWEVDQFPTSMHAAFDLVDEVWAVSSFAAAAIGAVSSKPVFAFPHSVPVPSVPEFTRAELGMPGGFVFLFICDLMSVAERKNPIGVVEAFKRAFGPGEGPSLVVKTISGEMRPTELERLRYAARGRQDVVIVDGYRARAEILGMQSLCDCYASLHRSEGFGLTLAEAMALGKPTIATGYSGNMDYMTDDNSFLVPFRLVAVPRGYDPYPTNAKWADPDLEAAARLMRHVVSNPEEAAERAARAVADLRSLHSPEVRGDWIIQRLRAIRNERRRTPVHTPKPEVDGAAVDARSRAASLLSRGPDMDMPTRTGGVYGGAARSLRRLIRRALTNQEVHQRDVGQALLQSIDDTETRLITTLREERALTDRRLDNIRTLLATTIETRAKTLGARLDDAQMTLGARLDDAQMRLRGAEASVEAVANRIGQWQAHFEAIPYTSDPSLIYMENGNGDTVLGYRDARQSDGTEGYQSFEDVFRGSEEFIRDRQAKYLELLRPFEPVLDIGCGRGEMLDLLRSAGIKAFGVDADEGMVARCREKGLDVRFGDGIELLAGQPEQSVGAIFCAQVIEHLPHEQLIRLFELSRVKLKPRGLLVTETVNPHSLRALKTFWTDVTHRHPIFPETLVALCRSLGFVEARVIHPNGSGRFQDDQWIEGEYAVLAFVPDVAPKTGGKPAAGT